MDGNVSDTGNLWLGNELFQNLFPPGEGGFFWWLDRRSRRWLYLGIPASAFVLMLLYCIRCRRRGRPRIPPTIDAREEKEPCYLKPATFPEEKEFAAFCTAFDMDSNVAWLQVVDDDFHLFGAFLKDLEDYFSGSASCLEDPQPGDYCVVRAHHSDKWVRGRVLGEDDSGEVEVEYVDHGKQGQVLKENVKELIRAFCYLPCKAVKCRLDEESGQILALNLDGAEEPFMENEENMKFDFVVTDETSDPPEVAVKPQTKPLDTTDGDPSRTVDSGIENWNSDPDSTDRKNTETQDVSLTFEDKSDSGDECDGEGDTTSPARQSNTQSWKITASPPPSDNPLSYRLQEMEITQGKYFVRGSTSCPITLQWTDTNCSHVSVEGSFNDWTATPLKSDGEGVFSLSLDLHLGQHQFFFRVDDKRKHNPKLPTLVNEDGSILNYIDVEPLNWGRQIHVEADGEKGSGRGDGSEGEVLNKSEEKVVMDDLEKMEDLTVTKGEDADTISATLSWGDVEDS